MKERYIPHWLAQPYIRPGIADGAEGGNNATKPEPAQPGAGGIINPQAMQSIEEKRVARETSSSDENDEKKKKLRVRCLFRNTILDCHPATMYLTGPAAFHPCPRPTLPTGISAISCGSSGTQRGSERRIQCWPVRRSHWKIPGCTGGLAAETGAD